MVSSTGGISHLVVNYLVSLHVERQVITSGKLPLTQMTLERLGTGVFAVVTSQLVRPGKLPTAAVP
jgi:hypothetical protein